MELFIGAEKLYQNCDGQTEQCKVRGSTWRYTEDLGCVWMKTVQLYRKLRLAIYGKECQEHEEGHYFHFFSDWSLEEHSFILFIKRTFLYIAAKT